MVVSPTVRGAPKGRRPLLEIATKLVVPEITPGWVLGLYPDAGEAAGTFHYRSKPGRCTSPGPAIDPDRASSEAARRARTKVRRYVVANRLDRLGTLTYRGDGLHDERRLRRHIGHVFKRLRYEVVGQPFPYLWVPEWHKTDHGLHAHFAVDLYIEHDALASVWPHGFVHIKRLRHGAGTLDSARRASGYVGKYVGKSFEEHERSPGLHRYECAQGFAPKVERIVGRTRGEAIALASERMGRAPARLWSSEETDDWQGPPAVWAGWDD
jgi:hypothetical protein